jgi:hypothetical protein
MRSAYKILVENSESKRSFGRIRHRCESVYWIQLAKDKDQWQVLVKLVMDLQVHKRQGIS